jgi:hypothetical protein
MEIALTIEFDNAIQVGASGAPLGVGATIGRTISSLATGGGAAA